MATKSKPVEAPPAAPIRRGQVRYSVSKADLRERGIYEEPRGLPLPNVADLMSYLLKGMVLFLLYTAVRGVWPESAPPRQEQRAQLASPKQGHTNQGRANQSQGARDSGAMKQLENLNETINSATDSLADTLRDLVGRDTTPDL